MDVYQVGDELMVKLHAYGKGKIVVRSRDFFIKESGLVTSELEAGMFAYGIVRKIEDKNPEISLPKKHIYTSIGFKLEGLSPESQYVEVEEGDAVIFKVNQIRKDGSIRGKIIRRIEKYIK